MQHTDARLNVDLRVNGKNLSNKLIEQKREKFAKNQSLSENNITFNVAFIDLYFMQLRTVASKKWKMYTFKPFDWLSILNSYNVQNTHLSNFPMKK